MKIITIARTEPKQSYSDDNVQWYKEYSVGTFESEKERDEFSEKYPYSDALEYITPHIAMRRRIDVAGGKETPREWEFFYAQGNIYDAALDIGDTDFIHAKSCNPIHAQVLAYWAKINQLQDELERLRDSILPHKYQAKSNLAMAYNKKYDAELKNRKLYKKTMAGTAPKEVVDEIRNRLMGEYNGELKTIENRIEEIHDELKNLDVRNF